ncbi:hypothetical protein [Marispirochaeta sp.]|uniref:hypothetical protein n=1 Tax=Marispirochaeta sp. TaxID=2038653 RepID=UPI0029C8145B|nr:hypothetical protein [Marispirochaeta sp.]
MGDPAMTIGPEELQKIGDYVRLHLAEWMGNVHNEREMGLMERSIRIEEELKAQRQVMETRFEAMDKRFEALQELMETRFEAVDKRFEAIQKQMDVRFEAVDKRFTSMQWMMGLGFTLMAALMGVLNFF